MSKARTLANLISDNAELADGQISVAEVVGAAPLASPTFTGTVTTDAVTMNGYLTVNGGGVDVNTVIYPNGIAMEDSRAISFGTGADFELSSGGTFLDHNLKDNARHLRIINGLTEHHRFSGDGNVIFNNSGADADFRVESDNSTHALFVNAGDDKVSINTGSTHGTLTIEHNLNNSSDWWTNAKGVLYLANTNASGMTAIKLNNANDTRASLVFNTSGTGRFQLFDRTSTQERLGITASETIINEDSADVDFRIEGNNNASMFFLDGGNDRVGIGHNVPRAKLDIMGQGTSATNLSMLIGSDEGGTINPSRTNNTDKACRIGLPHYNTSQSPTALMVASSTSGANSIFIGGGTSVMNAATQVNIYTADNTTTGTGVGRVQVTGSNMVVNDAGGDFDFRVESDALSHVLFVDASNNSVGMGASNASNYGARMMSSINGGSSYAAIACVNTATSGIRRQIDFFDGSSTTRKGAIETNGTGTTYNTTSDRRLKDNIQPIADATDKLMAMNPVSHKWIADPEADAVHGFIAQEMQEIVPEAVSGDPDGEEMMSMDYGRITPVLVAALQDAMKEITALKERVAELEAK